MKRSPKAIIQEKGSTSSLSETARALVSVEAQVDFVEGEVVCDNHDKKNECRVVHVVCSAFSLAD